VNGPSDPVPTRGLASLLAALQPAAFNRLRAQFPEEQELFDTRFVLGPKATETAAVSLRRKKALQALVEEALAASKVAVPYIVQQIGTRMQRARLSRLSGGIASILSAAMLAAQTAGALPINLQLLWSIVSMLGALLVFWGEHLEKPLVGQQRSLGELLADVLVAEDGMSEVRLRMLANDAADTSSLMDIARRANEAAARIRKAMVFGGFKPPTEGLLVPLRAGQYK
jgi:hypothetical protein